MCFPSIIADESSKLSTSDTLKSITPKLHLTFPLLNLQKMSEEQKKQLHQELFAESEDMMYKFQKLFSATRQSLVKQCISVGTLLKHLDCLGSIQPTLKGSNLQLLGCWFLNLENRRVLMMLCQ